MRDWQDWKPTATRDDLCYRYRFLRCIRTFFAYRGVLEVDTPLLGHHGVTDPWIESFTCVDYQGNTRYLQTSPEYAMKRLLAAGSGDIYQICKAFRMEACGRWHRPEFTILEWYRCGMSLSDLMEETAILIQELLETGPAKIFSYQEAFERWCQIDPLEAEIDALRDCVKQHECYAGDHQTLDKDDCLQLLMTAVIEPQLTAFPLVMISQYPASQAALARLTPNDPRTAQRFEVFLQGIECGNGFEELTDAQEQKERFIQDQQKRQQQGQTVPSMDTRFLAALESGLPACSGIAMGLDRLIALGLSGTGVGDAMAFGDHEITF